VRGEDGLRDCTPFWPSIDESCPVAFELAERPDSVVCGTVCSHGVVDDSVPAGSGGVVGCGESESGRAASDCAGEPGKVLRDECARSSGRGDCDDTTDVVLRVGESEREAGGLVQVWCRRDGVDCT